MFNKPILNFANDFENISKINNIHNNSCYGKFTLPNVQLVEN